MTRFGPDYPSDETFPAVRISFFGPVINGVEGFGVRTFAADEVERIEKYVAAMEDRGFRVVRTDIG